MLKYAAIDGLIEIAQHAFSTSQEMKNLLDKDKALPDKIVSLCRLLLAGKSIEVTDSHECGEE